MDYPLTNQTNIKTYNRVLNNFDVKVPSKRKIINYICNYEYDYSLNYILQEANSNMIYARLAYSLNNQYLHNIYIRQFNYYINMFNEILVNKNHKKHYLMNAIKKDCFLTDPLSNKSLMDGHLLITDAL
jgi:hypothetical protein